MNRIGRNVKRGAKKRPHGRQVRPGPRAKKRSSAQLKRDLMRALAHISEQLEDLVGAGVTAFSRERIAIERERLEERLRGLHPRAVELGLAQDPAYLGTVSRLEKLIKLRLGDGHWYRRPMSGSPPPGVNLE